MAQQPDEVAEDVVDSTAAHPRLQRIQRPLEIAAAVLYLPALGLHLAHASDGWAVVDTVLWSGVWALFLVELLIGVGLSPDRRAWLRAHLLLVAVVFFGFPALPAIFEIVPGLQVLSVAGLFEVVDLAKLSGSVGMLHHFGHHRGSAGAMTGDGQQDQGGGGSSRRWARRAVTVLLVAICALLSFGAVEALLHPHADATGDASASTRVASVAETVWHAPTGIQDILILAFSVVFAVVVVEVVPRRRAARQAARPAGGRGARSDRAGGE